MEAYQKEVKKIAEEFDAVFVPLQEVFDAAFQKRESSYWIWGWGYIQRENGHGLIAKQWLKCTKELLGGTEHENYKI